MLAIIDALPFANRSQKHTGPEPVECRHTGVGRDKARVGPAPVSVTVPPAACRTAASNSAASRVGCSDADAGNAGRVTPPGHRGPGRPEHQPPRPASRNSPRPRSSPAAGGWGPRQGQDGARPWSGTTWRAVPAQSNPDAALGALGRGRSAIPAVPTSGASGAPGAAGPAGFSAVRRPARTPPTIIAPTAPNARRSLRRPALPASRARHRSAPMACPSIQSRLPGLPSSSSGTSANLISPTETQGRRGATACTAMTRRALHVARTGAGQPHFPLVRARPLQRRYPSAIRLSEWPEHQDRTGLAPGTQAAPAIRSPPPGQWRPGDREAEVRPSRRPPGR